ncbi:helix-turn-helix domain-containing protein [Acetobacter senegalensis]|uniref:helix-turn-helix domain-containing protein n=1 Tax=Acetobacter senegalensis TaxID=446692 RepID=UPI001EE10362|nr:helix-turn-helix domain-containing protein [Acetobacter senegalensis]MCG4273918.1 helix-turn-helix domain-containing protein [Acetobacter senegalensis]
MTGRTITIEGVMTPDDIIRELSQKCEKYGAKAALARKAGLHPSEISDALSRRREVTPKIANALGYMQPRFFVPMKKRADAS